MANNLDTQLLLDDTQHQDISPPPIDASKALDPSKLGQDSLRCDGCEPAVDGRIPPLTRSEGLSVDEFEALWPYCFFHSHQPDLYNSDDWSSCRTLNKAISHVVTHAVKRHGLIRGVHHQSRGKSKRYLGQCININQLHHGRRTTCIKRSRIAEWTRDELKFISGTHSGPSVCLRCYTAMASRHDLRLHMNAATLCPDREQLLSKKRKAMILYATFCSDKLPSIWTPPQAKDSSNNLRAVEPPASGSVLTTQGPPMAPVFLSSSRRPGNEGFQYSQTVLKAKSTT